MTGKKRKRVKLALTHSFYVGGLTFFSTLSTQFIDQVIIMPELLVCLWTFIISFGMAFFASMSLQSKNGTYIPQEERKIQEKTKKCNKRIKRTLTKYINKDTYFSPLFWRELLISTHAPINVKKNGCLS